MERTATVLSPSWELSVNHSASNYGQPVIVQRGTLIAYGPNNIISNESGFIPAWRHVEQLAGTLSMVAKESAADRGLDFDEEADAVRTAMIEEQIGREEQAVVLSGLLHDDGLIDPRDTRAMLCDWVRLARRTLQPGPHPQGFRP